MEKNMCFIFILFIWINHTAGSGAAAAAATVLFITSSNIGHIYLGICLITMKQLLLYTRAGKYVHVFVLYAVHLNISGYRFVILIAPTSTSLTLWLSVSLSFWLSLSLYTNFSNSTHGYIHAKQTFEVGLHTYAYSLSLSLSHSQTHSNTCVYCFHTRYNILRYFSGIRAFFLQRYLWRWHEIELSCGETLLWPKPKYQ